MHELVHVAHLELSLRRGVAYFPVVVKQRLEVLVHLERLPGEAQVKRAQAPHVLVVLVPDELHDDLALGLDLEHLQREAQEVTRPVNPAVDAPERSQVRREVHQRLGGNPEALLLPVRHVVDLRPRDLLHQVLRGKKRKRGRSDA